jgi:hypothetical protein
LSPVSDGSDSDEDDGEDGLEVYGVWWKGAEGEMEFGGPGTKTGRKRERKVNKGRPDARRCGPRVQRSILGLRQGRRGRRRSTES